MSEDAHDIASPVPAEECRRLLGLALIESKKMLTGREVGLVERIEEAMLWLKFKTGLVTLP